MALETGLRANWRFEGNSNDNKGTYNGTDNAITYGTSYGKIGQGALFQSSSPSYITFPNSTLGETTFSVNLWINYSGNENVELISNMFGDPYIDSRFWGIFLDASSGTRIFFTIRNTSYTQYVYYSDYITLNSGWNMITVVVNSGGYSVSFYLNGSFLNSSGIANYDFLNTKKLVVGCYNDNGFASKYNGYLDEISIWATNLSSSDISTLYNNGAGMYFDGTSFVSPPIIGTSKFLQLF